MDAQIKATGLDAKTSYLDFFGVPVKAAETLMFVNGMKQLARKVSAARPLSVHRSHARPHQVSTMALYLVGKRRLAGGREPGSCSCTGA